MKNSLPAFSSPLPIFVLGSALCWFAYDMLHGNVPQALSLWCDRERIWPGFVIWLASGFCGCALMMYSRTKGRRLHEISAFMSEPAQFDTPMEFIGSMASQEMKLRSEPKIGLDTIFWVAAFFVVYSGFLGVILLLMMTIASGVTLIFTALIYARKKFRPAG